MKIFFDLFPVVIFFVLYKTVDIYAATIAAMVAALLNVLFTRFYHKKFDTTQVLTLVILLVLGGLTLGLQDERFIKWKPTLVNGGLAVLLIGYALFSGNSGTQRLLGKNLTLPKPVWFRLDCAWVVYFVFSGVLNLWVAYNFSTDTWVNFKLFGLLGLTFVFILGLGVYISSYVKEDAQNESKS